MSPILTPYQNVELLIENDMRNIGDLLRLGIRDRDLHARVIADCAVRLFQAREVDSAHGGRELERRAERNLREALREWI